MMRKILGMMLACALVSGCTKKDENDAGSGDEPQENGDEGAGLGEEQQPGGEQPAGEQPQQEAFTLSIPQDKWAASKFCPDVRPELPEDPTPAYRFDYATLDTKLGGDGLVGHVHGAVPMYQQYVFTLRTNNFFQAEQFSLVPTTPEVAQALAGLKRHDKVKLKGAVFQNGSPLTHIKVSSLEVLERFATPTDNEYAFDISKLKGQTRFEVFGQVHAVVKSDTLGRAFVVEHDDLMLPLAVPASLDAAAEPLYRGDIVNVAVRVVEHPHGPPHLVVDDEKADAIKIVDPVVNCHDMETTVTGFLTKFEKSPAISTDVYAVRVVDANGIGRNYTLFPDVDPNDPDAFMELFGKLAAKAKDAWEASPEAPSVVRNYRKKETIKVVVKGRLNVVSTEQANPQVYVKSADDLTITVAP